MRIAIPVLTFALLSTLANFSPWSSAAVALWIGYLLNFTAKLNHSVAFREYILMMYGLNYLFSPAITYEVTQSLAVYKMRLDPETYFAVAIPAMLCLHLGLFSIKSRIFTYSFVLDKLQRVLNENLFKQWVVGFFLLTFLERYLPGDLQFLAYLLGSLKYVAAFALFIIDSRKFKWFLIGLIFMEVTAAFAIAMFHDMVIWILFFSMVWTYVKKPSAYLKTILGVVAIFALFLLQTIKGSYRQQLSSGKEGDLSTLTTAVNQQNTGNEGGLFNGKNFAFAVTRANQGWIFSSAMQKVEWNQNFQGMELIKKYAEAAFLPRALAPDKLQAGDTKIFNEFSGIKILKGTSMALGLFADGYISFGYSGTLVFAFVFGLMCGLVFKLIERWTAISPFFAFLYFPLLNFAVRADCETQTWMGHVVKGAVVFSIVMYFAKQYFQRKGAVVHASQEQEEKTDPQLVPQTI